MTTNGISIPDEDKVEIPEGEEATEAMWIELTNQRGDEGEDHE
ncbi:hypothetical protein [Adlercreutzia caecimuris]|nr:hypothetical protein [Adlercreutzia caecimuris]